MALYILKMLPKITKHKIPKSCSKFENNKGNLPEIGQNFPLCVHCIEIAVTVQFALKQVSSLQKFKHFAVDLKWRPKLPIWND